MSQIYAVMVAAGRGKGENTLGERSPRGSCINTIYTHTHIYSRTTPAAPFRVRVSPLSRRRLNWKVYLALHANRTPILNGPPAREIQYYMQGRQVPISIYYKQNSIRVHIITNGFIGCFFSRINERSTDKIEPICLTTAFDTGAELKSACRDGKWTKLKIDWSRKFL